MNALEYIGSPAKVGAKPVFVVHGDEDFLRREALMAIRQAVLGGNGDNDFALSNFVGPEATLADVLDELSMLPLLAPRRLVVVADADPFITRYRERLEEALSQSLQSGILVLVVKTWKSNTRLAKLVERIGIAIECKAGREPDLVRWAVRWARQRYSKRLTDAAASMLIELVGPAMGLLDRELEKLATFVGEGAEIGPSDVDRLVGAGRVETTWQMIDAAGEGRSKDALDMLNRLLVAGEAPVGILAAISWQLRRLAQAGRLAALGQPLSSALRQVGVQPFALARAEAQLRRLGSHRADLLYRWLLAADLDLKGSSPLPPRTVLERLILRLSAKRG